ncbi:MAG: 50S ribosomal protein L6 [Candidatus Aenigmarchaeota archaeon]|nr:50S ribosomal protein L6 [Candidatus Aenigmarchaeota archaeon]
MIFLEENIAVPEGIEAKITENVLSVKGDKGEMERKFTHPHVSMELKDGIVVKTESERKKDRAVVGTWKVHVNNMFKGVSDGYTYKMKIVYVHFPMTAKVEDNKVVINNFVGGKGKRYANIVGEAQVEIKKEDIEITGCDKEAVGQTAANIEQACKKKNKDIRIFHDGIYITHKG